MRGRAALGQQRGVALILTLVALAIVATMAAGTGTLVLGHQVSARTEQDAAKALNLAEAALNYQIQRITAAGLHGAQSQYDGTNAATASYGAPPSSLWPVPKWSTTRGNPQPLPIPGTLLTHGGKSLHGYLDLKGVNTGDGSGDVWIAWVSPALDTYNNSPQGIYGAATVNGVTRVVRVKGGAGDDFEGARGIFDEYALFGIIGVRFNGSLTSNRPIGSNGAITLGGSSSVAGVSLYGPNASVSGGNYPTPQTYPNPIAWPAITTIANQVAAGLDSYAGADKPAYYRDLSTTNGIRNFGPRPLGSNDNALASRKRPHETSWTGGLPPNGNLPPQADNIRLVGKPWGTNYYLTRFEHTMDIAADIKDGPVTLWIDVDEGGPTNLNAGSNIRAYNSASNPNADDSLLSVNDAKQFKIYYRNPAGHLTINGATQFYALFYAHDVVDGTPVGTIKLAGNATYNGAIIAYSILQGNGSVLINFPPNDGLSFGEGLLYYGSQGVWQEVNPVRGN